MVILANNNFFYKPDTFNKFLQIYKSIGWAQYLLIDFTKQDTSVFIFYRYSSFIFGFGNLLSGGCYVYIKSLKNNNSEKEDEINLLKRKLFKNDIKYHVIYV